MYVNDTTPAQYLLPAYEVMYNTVYAQQKSAHLSTEVLHYGLMGITGPNVSVMENPQPKYIWNS